MKFVALFWMVISISIPAVASAQTVMSDPMSNLPITNDLSAGGGGWGQIKNVNELRTFAIDVVVALVLAAAIALHPVRVAARSSTLDFIMPRLFAFYALIGMVVGFLVDQHGYIIGFVVFGIGALLRFRSNLDDPIDTVEMILVTVLGLCVGLDLPVMAVLIGVVSWVLIWIAGRRLPIELRLQADSPESLEDALAQVRQIAKQENWTEAFVHRAHSKNAARLILLHHASIGEEGVEAALLTGLNLDGLTWKLGT
jgi:hypothetical protein